MLSTALDEILGSRSKISVLRSLFAQDSLGGREIARRTGLSPRAASVALNQLVAAGILRRQAAGSTHLFSVDRRRHLVQASLARLFNEEADLPNAMGRRIMRAIGRTQCVSAAIFGSGARGEAGPGSDVDVLVLLADSSRVRPAKERLQAGAEEFFDLFGLRLSPYVIGASEFAARLKKGDPLMKAMVREARVVHGMALAEVLLDES